MPNISGLDGGGAVGCCQLVGNLSLTGFDGCITSINVSANTEVNTQCVEPKAGPTIGNVSITGYASDDVYVGCPSQAGVSINWLRKYDCENDVVYFINAGEGSSFMSGSFDGISYISLNKDFDRSYVVINANSNSGPTGIYLRAERSEGYGLNYGGKIFSFNTSSTTGLIKSNFGIGEGSMYLQNFSFAANPGSFPTVSYSFLFTISEGD